jgi:hypothetical protein
MFLKFWERVISLISAIKDTLNSFWIALSPTQKLYFLALLPASFWLLFSHNNYFWLLIAGGLGLLALVWEVLPKFTWLWNSILGKGFLLVIYAIVANFALVVSNQLISQVVGIDPSELFYTQSIIALFTAPLWIMLISLLFMLVYLLLLNILLLTLALLRVLRVNTNPLIERESFPIITILVRLVIAPIAIFTLGNMMTIYGDDAFRISHTDDNANTTVVVAPQEKEDEEDKVNLSVGNFNNIAFKHLIAGFQGRIILC